MSASMYIPTYMHSCVCVWGDHSPLPASLHFLGGAGSSGKGVSTRLPCGAAGVPMSSSYSRVREPEEGSLVFYDNTASGHGTKTFTLKPDSLATMVLDGDHRQLDNMGGVANIAEVLLWSVLSFFLFSWGLSYGHTLCSCPSSPECVVWRVSGAEGTHAELLKVFWFSMLVHTLSPPHLLPL